MRAFLFSFLIFATVSCTKDDKDLQPEEPASFGDIIGKWDIRYPDAPDNVSLIYGYFEFFADSTLIFTDKLTNNMDVTTFRIDGQQAIRIYDTMILSNVRLNNDSLFFRMTVGETYDFVAIKDTKAIATGNSTLLCRDWLLSKKEGGIDIYDQENRYATGEIVSAKVVFSPAGYYFWRYYKEDERLNSAGTTNWDWHANIDKAVRYWDPRQAPHNDFYHIIYELTDSSLVLSSQRTSKKLYLSAVRN